MYLPNISQQQPQSNTKKKLISLIKSKSQYDKSQEWKSKQIHQMSLISNKDDKTLHKLIKFHQECKKQLIPFYYSYMHCKKIQSIEDVKKYLSQSYKKFKQKSSIYHKLMDIISRREEVLSTLHRDYNEQSRNQIRELNIILIQQFQKWRIQINDEQALILYQGNNYLLKIINDNASIIQQKQNDQNLLSSPNPFFIRTNLSTETYQKQIIIKSCMELLAKEKAMNLKKLIGLPNSKYQKQQQIQQINTTKNSRNNKQMKNNLMQMTNDRSHKLSNYTSKSNYSAQTKIFPSMKNSLKTIKQEQGEINIKLSDLIKTKELEVLRQQKRKTNGKKGCQIIIKDQLQSQQSNKKNKQIKNIYGNKVKVLEQMIRSKIKVEKQDKKLPIMKETNNYNRSMPNSKKQPSKEKQIIMINKIKEHHLEHQRISSLPQNKRLNKCKEENKIIAESLRSIRNHSLQNKTKLQVQQHKKDQIVPIKKQKIKQSSKDNEEDQGKRINSSRVSMREEIEAMRKKMEAENKAVQEKIRIEEQKFIKIKEQQFKIREQQSQVKYQQQCILLQKQHAEKQKESYQLLTKFQLKVQSNESELALEKQKAEKIKKQLKEKVLKEQLLLEVMKEQTQQRQLQRKEEEEERMRKAILNEELKQQQEAEMEISKVYEEEQQKLKKMLYNLQTTNEQIQLNNAEREQQLRILEKQYQVETERIQELEKELKNIKDTDGEMSMQNQIQIVSEEEEEEEEDMEKVKLRIKKEIIEQIISIKRKEEENQLEYQRKRTIRIQELEQEIRNNLKQQQKDKQQIQGEVSLKNESRRDQQNQQSAIIHSKGKQIHSNGQEQIKIHHSNKSYQSELNVSLKRETEGMESIQNIDKAINEKKDNNKQQQILQISNKNKNQQNQSIQQENQEQQKKSQFQIKLNDKQNPVKNESNLILKQQQRNVQQQLEKSEKKQINVVQNENKIINEEKLEDGYRIIKEEQKYIGEKNTNEAQMNIQQNLLEVNQSLQKVKQNIQKVNIKEVEQTNQQIDTKYNRLQPYLEKKSIRYLIQFHEIQRFLSKFIGTLAQQVQQMLSYSAKQLNFIMKNKKVDVWKCGSLGWFCKESHKYCLIGSIECVGQVHRMYNDVQIQTVYMMRRGNIKHKKYLSNQIKFYENIGYVYQKKIKNQTDLYSIKFIIKLPKLHKNKKQIFTIQTSLTLQTHTHENKPTQNSIAYLFTQNISNNRTAGEIQSIQGYYRGIIDYNRKKNALNSNEFITIDNTNFTSEITLYLPLYYVRLTSQQLCWLLSSQYQTQEKLSSSIYISPLNNSNLIILIIQSYQPTQSLPLDLHLSTYCQKKLSKENSVVIAVPVFSTTNQTIKMKITQQQCIYRHSSIIDYSYGSVVHSSLHKNEYKYIKFPYVFSVFQMDIKEQKIMRPIYGYVVSKDKIHQAPIQPFMSE